MADEGWGGVQYMYDIFTGIGEAKFWHSSSLPRDFPNIKREKFHTP